MMQMPYSTKTHEGEMDQSVETHCIRCNASFVWGASTSVWFCADCMKRPAIAAAMRAPPAQPVPPPPVLEEDTPAPAPRVSRLDAFRFVAHVGAMMAFVVGGFVNGDTPAIAALAAVMQAVSAGAVLRKMIDARRPAASPVRSSVSASGSSVALPTTVQAMGVFEEADGLVATQVPRAVERPAVRGTIATNRYRTVDRATTAIINNAERLR